MAIECERFSGQEITADLVLFKKVHPRSDTEVVANHNSSQLINVLLQSGGGRSSVLEKMEPFDSYPTNFYSAPKQDQFVYTPSDEKYYFEFGFSPFSLFSGIHSTIQVSYCA